MKTFEIPMKTSKFLAVALLLVAFTACKKDYTCTCTVVGTDVAPKVYTDAKKSDAQADCDKLNSNFQAVDITNSCVLD